MFFYVFKQKKTTVFVYVLNENISVRFRVRVRVRTKSKQTTFVRSIQFSLDCPSLRPGMTVQVVQSGRC